MNFINLTPHQITVYKLDQFENLEQLNTTNWIADGIIGDPVLKLESKGSLRISTEAKLAENLNGIPIMETKYGEIVGIPDNYNGEVMVVSLPTLSMAKQSNHELADKMVSPYQIVRLRSKASTVIGCIGFTR